MESLVSSHRSTNSISDIDRRKKRKLSPSSSSSSRTKDGEKHARWRSDKQQRIYSAKLVQALRQVRLNSSSSSSSSPRGSRAVREAADRALAIAARGRTIWSRAILTSRIKLKFRKQKRHRLAAVTVATAASKSGSRSRKPPKVSVMRLKAKNLPAVQRKVRVLGRLVPGCRKQPLPVILEEATDYIAALEMQIRAMSSLADLLSKHSSGTSSITPPST